MITAKEARNIVNSLNLADDEFNAILQGVKTQSKLGYSHLFCAYDERLNKFDRDNIVIKLEKLGYSVILQETRYAVTW